MDEWVLLMENHSIFGASPSDPQASPRPLLSRGISTWMLGIPERHYSEADCITAARPLGAGGIHDEARLRVCKNAWANFGELGGANHGALRLVVGGSMLSGRTYFPLLQSPPARKASIRPRGPPMSQLRFVPGAAGIPPAGRSLSLWRHVPTLAGQGQGLRMNRGSPPIAKGTQ